MADTKFKYGSSSAVTITLASLANQPGMLAGQQSAAIDNTTNLYLDYLLSGQVTVGSPTALTSIGLYVVGCMDDTTWPDTVTANNSAWVTSTVGVSNGYLRYAASLQVDTATANRAYYFNAVSVASLFNGILPKKFVVVVVNASGAALHATAANHVLTLTPVFLTTA